MNKYLYILPWLIMLCTVSAFAQTPESFRVCYDSDTTLNPGPDFTATQYRWSSRNSTTAQWSLGNWGPYVSDSVTNITSYCEYRLEKLVNDDTLVYKEYHINPYEQLDAQLSVDDSSVCRGDSVTLTATATGGAGTYSYRWGIASDSASQLGTNIFVVVPQDSTRYRVIVKDSLCGSVQEDQRVYVYPGAVAGHINTDSVLICHGTTGNLSVTDGVNSSNRQWQWTGDLLEAFQDIQDSTGSSIQISSLIPQTRYYRVRFIHYQNCDTVYSDTAVVTFLPPLQGARLTMSDSSTVCYGASGPAISIQPPQGGDNNFSGMWQRSSDGISFVDTIAQIGNVFNPGLLYDTVFFRLKSNSNLCGEVFSDTIVVNVYHQLHPGTLMDDTTICFGTSTGIRFEILPYGSEPGFDYEYFLVKSGTASGSYYQSTLSPDGFQTGIIYQGFCYRAYVVSHGCTSDMTPESCVNVFDPISEVNTISINGAKQDTVCYGKAPSYPIEIDYGFHGGDSLNNHYQWYFRKTNTISTPLPNDTTQSLQLDSLFHSGSYQLVMTNACGTKYSDWLYIHVFDTMTAPVIAKDVDTTLCYYHEATPISINTYPTGSSNDYLYLWKHSPTGQDGTWTDVPAPNGDITYSPGYLTDTTYYQLLAWPARCGQDYEKTSNIVKISVLPKLTLQSLHDTTVCYNESAPLGIAVKGGVEFPSQYRYRWYGTTSDDSNSFANTPSSLDSSFTTQAMTSGRYYKISVSSNKGCEGALSNAAHVTVFNPFIDGTISMDGDKKADSVCYSMPMPGTIAIDNGLLGGDSANNEYIWTRWHVGSATIDTLFEYNEDSLWIDHLYDSYSYRLEVHNQCGSRFSDTVHVYVTHRIIPPIITKETDTTFCHNASATAIHMTVNPSGNVGKYCYQWESSNDGLHFDSIAGTYDSTSYHPGELSATTQFRLHCWPEQCGLQYQGYSDTVSIIILPSLTLTVLKDTNICYGDGTSLSVRPSGGVDSLSQYRYRWFQSYADNANAMPAKPSGTDSVFVIPSLTEGRFYRLEVSSAKGCVGDTSRTAHVTLFHQFNNGTLRINDDKNDTICYGQTQHHTIRIESGFGGGDSAVNQYRWYSQLSPSSSLRLVEGSGDTLFLGALYESSYYRLEVTNTCGTRHSDSVYIHVYDTMTKPVIARNADTTLCNSHNRTGIHLLDNTLTGSSGDYRYNWEYNNGSGWNDAPGESDSSDYLTLPLTQSTAFRLYAWPEYCGTGYGKHSDSVIVNVLPQLVAGSLRFDDDSICYGTAANLRFAIVPQGGVDSSSQYRFTWKYKPVTLQEWQSKSTGNDSTFTTDTLCQDYQFIAKVSSTKGCPSGNTSSVQVHVRGEFIPYIITDDLALDSACDGARPKNRPDFTPRDSLRGGLEPYTYTWEESLDGVQFHDYLDYATQVDSTLHINEIRRDVYFRLLTTSRDYCGTDTTDIMKIGMRQLPEPPKIFGADSIWCQNQLDVPYFFDSQEQNRRYTWEAYNGVINSEDDMHSVLIDWVGGDGSIVLIVENTVTGCIDSTDRFNVYVDTNDSAPQKTKIRLKTGANILICEDATPNAHYQWGFTRKATLEDTLIPNSNYRYVQLPHPIDTAKYDYFVDINYEQSKCVTRTYYLRDERDDDWWSGQGGIPSVKVSPNPSKGDFFLSVDDGIIGRYEVTLFDVFGRELFAFEDEDLLPGERLKIQNHLSQGVYYLVIKTDTWHQSIRVAVQ